MWKKLQINNIMQTKTKLSATSIFKLPTSTASIQDSVPTPFKHCVNALFVQTKVLASNVLSLHHHIAANTFVPIEIPTALSDFHLDLLGQALALQRYAGRMQGTDLQAEEWSDYADLWRLEDMGNVPAALARLQTASDKLASTYENTLPMAAIQPDQSTSFYMLAEHLNALDGYFLALE